MNIHFCEVCHFSILDRELLEGGAVEIDDNHVFCGNCVKSGRVRLEKPEIVAFSAPAETEPAPAILKLKRRAAEQRSSCAADAEAHPRKSGCLHPLRPAAGCFQRLACLQKTFKAGKNHRPSARNCFDEL